MEIFVGCASQTYAAAVAKPSGTRMRRAILLQLGRRFLQQVARSSDDVFGGDLY